MAAEPTAARSRRWHDALVPCGVGLLTILAYLPGSGRALGFDSSQTVGSYVRTPSILDAVRSQRLFNNHPAFSLIEHVIYTLSGSSEEWVLRVAPIVFAGVAAAVVVASLRRHLGTLPAVCGGVFFATNPIVIQLSREVRGYSLLLLCGVVSSAALAHLLGSEDSAHRRAWSVLYVVAVAVGTATHLYMAPIVLGQVVVVAARRAIDSDWVLRWAAGAGLGASIYVAMVPDMVDALRVGERTFKPDFPRQLAEVMVGSGLAAVLVAVPVVVGAISLLPRRRDLLAGGAAVLAAVAVTWLGTASVHLEARFHVWLVPGAAALAAVAVRRVPALALLLLAGATLNAWSVVADGYVEDPNVQPELGLLLDHAAAEGDVGCVTSFSVLPILGYTRHFDVVLDAADLAGCDVVAVPFPTLDRVLVDAARAEMAVEATYTADYEDGVAFARDPAYFDRLCREASADLCPP